MASNKYKTKSWNELKVAKSGDVSQVPVHLAELGKPSCPRWRHVGALKMLYEDFKIYSAAAKAVPEVVELLRREETPNKDTLLVLLAATVCGRTQNRVVWGLDLRKEEVKRFYARGVAKEVWVETWQGRATYLALLEHAEPMVRGAAAFLLAFDYEGAKAVEEAVSRCVMAEQDTRAKASMLLCLGYARHYGGGSSGGGVEFSRLTEGSDLLVRGAAILAELCASTEPSILKPEQWSTLVDWCGQVKVNANGYPWNNGIVDMHCARVVEGRCVEGGLVAAEILAEAIRRYGPQGRGSAWAGGILELAFEPAYYAVSAGPFMIDASLDEPSKYTERQKKLLEVLASYSFAAPFLSYGIPAEVLDRRRWLGLEAPGPMERVVTVEVLGKVRTWPVWLCMKVQQASEPTKPIDVAALLGSVLTPTQLLEVRVEYSNNAYSLRLGGEVFHEVMAHSKEMLPWARSYLSYISRIFHEFGGTLSGGSLAGVEAMRVLIKEGYAEEILPEHDVLINPGNRFMLETVSLPRRENIIASRVKGTLRDDAGAMWSAGVRNMVTWSLNNLDLYPTEVVANALFDVRDHIVAHGFTEFSDVCAAIETECSKLADSHPEFGAVVKRRLAQGT
jgi:hypothetical protein